MKAIVNATPLIALALLDKLDLLRRMFDEVIVPAAVYEEVVTQGTGRPGAHVIDQAGWLRVMSPQVVPTLEPMLLGLDAGEVEVLLLAREHRPDWVLIDERQGRRVARALGLPVKGTLGILLAAVFGRAAFQIGNPGCHAAAARAGHPHQPSVASLASRGNGEVKRKPKNLTQHQTVKKARCNDAKSALVWLRDRLVGSGLQRAGGGGREAGHAGAGLVRVRLFCPLV
jgi:predicted nucleic acid-binding protein